MSDLNKNLVFIASGGRTGTTFFGEVLGKAIEDSYSVHEPDVFGKVSMGMLRRIRRFGLYHMVFGKLIGMTGLRPLGHRLLAGKISEDTCATQLRAMRDDYFRSIAAPLIIESSGRWWMVSRAVLKAWPDAKMIGVIRDPRDWIESWRRHQPRRHARTFMAWFPQGPLTPADMDDSEWIGRWKDLDQFGRLAWDWRAITMHLDEVQNESDNVRVFRFEDIFSGDTATFADLVEFAANHDGRSYEIKSLDGLLSQVRNASGGKRRAWQDWPAHEARLVEEMCGPMMRKFGYGQEPEWQALVQEEPQ